MLALLGQQQARALHLIEAPMPPQIGLLHLQPVALLVQQRELYLLEGIRARERADKHLQLVPIATGTEPHVAHREIGGLLAPVVVAQGGHDRKVDAGLGQLRLLDVDEAGLAAIGIQLKGVTAAEHPLGAAGDLLQLPVTHACAGSVFGQKTWQIFGIDPEEIDIDLIHVDRADGQAQLLTKRQYHAAGSKGGSRLQWPGLEGPALRLGPQPCLEGHLVTLVGRDLREVEGTAILGQDPLPLQLLAPLAHTEPGLPIGLGRQRAGKNQRQRRCIPILAGIGLHHSVWRPRNLPGRGRLIGGCRLVWAATGQEQTGQPCEQQG